MVMVSALQLYQIAGLETDYCRTDFQTCGTLGAFFGRPSTSAKLANQSYLRPQTGEA
jgi:hypothetical protein